jgi:glucose/arabinose dehydrogenase
LRSATAIIACLLAVAAAGCAERSEEKPDPPVAPASEGGQASHFALEREATGLVRPTWVGAAPGDPDALWVVEQPGRVLRLAGGRRETVLDLRDEVRTGAEQGTLGLAFHPDFDRNRRFFLHWSERRHGDTRVAEFRAGRDVPRRMLLRLEQPEENHNGGALAFGPDGRLYLGLGDGGGAFDPRATAQDRDDLLGKLVATDVDRAGRVEWKAVLTGLRNPWRFWFDPALNEVWIGDVGQDRIEEIDRVMLEPDEPPKNLGWSAYEGTRALDGHELDRSGELIWPVTQYTHDDGCSVTGGPIYRGTRVPRLSGRYVYGDFCSGALWTLRPAPEGRATDVRRERARAPQLTHIGTDADGELVMATAAGDILRATSVRAP